MVDRTASSATKETAHGDQDGHGPRQLADHAADGPRQLADYGTGRRSPRSRALTLVFLGSTIVSFLAASAAPTPLYARYAERWGFSALATTVVFGVYALTVLAGLLTFGRLSDHVGRRPVLLAGLALQRWPWSCSRPRAGPSTGPSRGRPCT